MNRLLRHFILSFFLSSFYLLVVGINAQGWERTFGSNVNDQAFSVIQTQDGGFAVVGFSESNTIQGTNITFIKTDENGVEQWSQSLGGNGDDKGRDLVQSQDGTYLVLGQTNSAGNGGDDIILIKTDQRGNELWRRTYGGPMNDRGFSISDLNDGGYVITGRSERVEGEGANVYVLRIDAAGSVIWEKFFGGENVDVGESVIETANGEIIVVGHTRSFATPNPSAPSAPSPDVYFIKLSAAGDLLVEKTFGNIEQDVAFDVVETAKGNFALAGVTTNNSNVYLLTVDKNGEELWSRSYGGTFDEIGYSIDLTQDGGFIIAGFKTVTPTSSQVYLLKTDGQGALEWERLFGSSFGQDAGRSVATTADGGYIVAGNFDVNSDQGSLLPLTDIYLIKTNDDGNIFRSIISGTVIRDLNTNCETDDNEKPLEDWLVRLRRGEEVLYATTDKDGAYSISVENGNYNVGLVVLNTAWEVCQNYNIAITEDDTMRLDFAARSTVEDCPILVVDVSTALLEPCQSSNYVINICNRGIETAEDAFVDVQFDPFLSVNFSTLPWVNHANNIYRFDIGDLVVEECGSFEVNATVSCDALVGQAHCVEAYAQPDAICVPPPPLWDGASIRIDGDCVGDSVRFILRNIGDGNMTTPLGFIVIEDNLELRQGGNFQLPSGLADTFYIAATSATYRIIAEQPPGHPHGQTTSAVVEGCPFGQPFNTGFVTAFSNADALPFYSVDCRESKLIAGNADMTPSPKGLGTENKIANTDELEYHIYFENTGSDIVKQVIIRDTLSSELDITSIVPGASSHPYDFEISNTGVLKFTFDDIDLFNKDANAAESFGFVKFKIAQKEGNPTGMVIQNRAAVHFDFGRPFLTNTTFHTIGGEQVQDFVEISTSTEESYIPELAVKIMPNPFDANQGTTIELIGLEGNPAIQFELFDIAGRNIASHRYNTHKFEFQPTTLPQGLYLYTIRVEGGLINTGKVFIK